VQLNSKLTAISEFVSGLLLPCTLAKHWSNLMMTVLLTVLIASMFGKHARRQQTQQAQQKLSPSAKRL